MPRAFAFQAACGRLVSTADAAQRFARPRIFKPSFQIVVREEIESD
jgi:hypothetical protein